MVDFESIFLFVKNSQYLCLLPPSRHSLLIPAGPAGRLSVAAVCRAGPTCCCSPELTTVSPAAAAGRRAGDCGSLVGSQSGRSAVDTVDCGHL